MKTAIRQLLDYLREDRCVYVHCQGGCDRTGALLAVIEGLCGVTEDDINHDYEMSSFYSLRNRNREYYTVDKGNEYDGDFKFAMSFIKGLLKHDNHLYVKYGDYYYDVEAYRSVCSTIKVEDPELIKELDLIKPGTLQDRFKLLMQDGADALTDYEIEELCDYLVENK